MVADPGHAGGWGRTPRRGVGLRGRVEPLVSPSRVRGRAICPPPARTDAHRCHAPPAAVPPHALSPAVSLPHVRRAPPDAGELRPPTSETSFTELNTVETLPGRETVLRRGVGPPAGAEGSLRPPRPTSSAAPSLYAVPLGPSTRSDLTALNVPAAGVSRGLVSTLAPRLRLSRALVDPFRPVGCPTPPSRFGLPLARPGLDLRKVRTFGKVFLIR